MFSKIYLPKIYALFKKELFSYFNSPIAYIFIAVFLIVGNWLFFNSFFVIGQANMRNYFILLPWIFLFLTPAITMRGWAEEKRSGTIEFLLTLPITDWQAVLGKFLAALAFLVVALVLTATLPVTVSYLGAVDVGPIIGSYLGAVLMGAAYLALGLFISSLTKNQIIAFIAAVAACFLFFFIGNDFVIMTAPRGLAPLLQWLGLGAHFDNIARGVIDTKDVIYYLSFIWLWLWLNKEILALRR
ncbi:ABC transporter [Candidatus Falkowbacteria bacterium CG10_big_fil_rev_8_21_14_0_10_44_15]|uniref:ABC transporter n=1 Tax=Candidatus Falkowbacteria bacterium CG10_big_fil_rev_8_21_14_0_10_44_15 TaxID=1974569 RepID=A0A2H0UZ68_9BACT|nr:MAG: ABC transporter [Candidatus Falkowbacteria bacterium CG10_big_fil_rev_8_21_14_0_10_44_15]